MRTCARDAQHKRHRFRRTSPARVNGFGRTSASGASHIEKLSNPIKRLSNHVKRPRSPTHFQNPRKHAGEVFQNRHLLWLSSPTSLYRTACLMQTPPQYFQRLSLNTKRVLLLLLYFPKLDRVEQNNTWQCKALNEPERATAETTNIIDIGAGHHCDIK
jgi:hypothetical protein